MNEHSDEKAAKVERIKEWLLAKHKKKPTFDGEIELNTDLIESRIVDSLRFMDFLLFLEELVGHEIEPSPDLINSMRTLQQIHDDIL